MGFSSGGRRSGRSRHRSSGAVEQILPPAPRAGRPLVQTNANGTITTRTYSNRGFLTDVHTTGPSGLLQDLTYTLDAAGMVSQVTSPFAEEGWTYGYDAFHRLTSAASLSSPTESQTFQYDTIGRITYNSRIGNYTYPVAGAPRPHAPTQAGTSALNYDANGNLESAPQMTLTWGADNLLEQVGATQFTYDGLGNRIKKETAGGSTSLYPTGDDFEITDGVVTKYVSASALGVVAKREGSTTYWLHSDRLGSIQTSSDADGVERHRRTFRPYGETISETGEQSRGWIGQRVDPETGLTYLHARYYDSALGVFVSPDPAGVVGGMNAFAYGHGDPTNLTDRSGLCPVGEMAIADRCWSLRTLPFRGLSGYFDLRFGPVADQLDGLLDKLAEILGRDRSGNPVDPPAGGEDPPGDNPGDNPGDPTGPTGGTTGDEDDDEGQSDGGGTTEFTCSHSSASYVVVGTSDLTCVGPCQGGQRSRFVTRSLPLGVGAGARTPRGRALPGGSVGASGTVEAPSGGNPTGGVGFEIQSGVALPWIDQLDGLALSYTWVYRSGGVNTDDLGGG